MWALLLVLALLVPSQSSVASQPSTGTSGSAAAAVVAADQGPADGLSLSATSSGAVSAARPSTQGGGGGLPLGWLVVTALAGAALLLAQRARPPTSSYRSPFLTGSRSRAPPAVAGT